MNSQKLYGRRLPNLSLTQAVEQAEAYLTDAIGLFYSPQACHLARWTGQSWETPRRALNPKTVFEARIFNPRVELRWLKQGNVAGTAVLLTEEPLENHNLSQTYIDKIEQRYLLWGEPSQEGVTINASWSRLSTVRIGQLEVPIAPNPQGRRIFLKSYEYLAEQDYGNTVVIQERLLKLDWETF